LLQSPKIAPYSEIKWLKWHT